MRIGVNGLFLVPGQGGGIENYFHHLMRDLPLLDREVEYVLVTDRRNMNMLAGGNTSNIQVIPYLIPSGPLRTPTRFVYEYTCLPFGVRRRHVDVLFSPAFIAPSSRRYASVVTVHDMRHIDFPQGHEPIIDRIFLGLVRRSVQSAAHILTVSEYAKRRIEAVYQVPPERITVTYNAPDPRYFPRLPHAEIVRVHTTYGLHTPYILSVATLLPHKNLDALIEAYAALRQQGETDAHLVLVGLHSVAAAPLEARIRAMGLGGQVILTGWVPDTDLPALYQGAAAFVLPSRYEGFGIPLLEAMASGVPVVTTTATALPEVAGDAALLVDPDDRAGMAAALGRILSDEALRAEMIGRGTERARQFTWRTTAEATLSAFHQALSPRPP